jgi:exonuclease SbcD
LRFLHTADWHLGRLFHGTSLLEDQAPLVEQVATLAREARVDAVLLAGDVYDRAIPPPGAVALLDDFLARLTLDAGVPLVAVAGNHDSAERLGFASRLLRDRGVYLSGRLERPGAPIVLHDEHGPVHVHALPYADPPTVRHVLEAPELGDHAASMGALVEAIRASDPGRARKVLVAHAFVSGCEESESERPLSVGGSGAVPASMLAGFDYVALGHLHRPQRAGGDAIRYSGSLAKYSFSEIAHRKSISIVELGRTGECTIEEVPLTVRRDLRMIEGTLDALLSDPEAGQSRDDYLLVRLLDGGALLDPMGRLREVYPNVMQLERPALEAGASAGHSLAEQRSKSVSELFDDFFVQVTGEALSEAERVAYQQTVEAAASAEREVST